MLPVANRYKILITGSRNYTSKNFVWRELSRILEGVPEDQSVELWQGKCPSGVDLFGRSWATANQPRVTNRDFPADWSQGARGGPERNKRMVLAGPDVCLAVILACTSSHCRRRDPHGSHGATQCADFADAQGIFVIRHDLWRKP